MRSYILKNVKQVKRNLFLNKKIPDKPVFLIREQFWNPLFKLRTCETRKNFQERVVDGIDY